MLGESRWLLHPFATVWRRLLRRGLFQPATRLGRLTAALHTPFDAFERASDAVARGNLKVFAEIGLEFARCLGEPDGAAFLAGYGQETRPTASATSGRRSPGTSAHARSRTRARARS